MTGVRNEEIPYGLCQERITGYKRLLKEAESSLNKDHDRELLAMIRSIR